MFMLIGELSERTGLSRDTIRFYEKKGLIRIPGTDRRENNYKEYSEKALNRLKLIKNIKGLGFTLHEIEAFLDQWNTADATCKSNVFTLEAKISAIELQIAELARIKQKLSESLQNCRNNTCEFEEAKSC